MMEKNWDYAQLSENEMKKIHSLEGVLGKTLVAFEQHAAFAKLSQEQLNKIKELEEKYGFILLAYHSVG